MQSNRRSVSWVHYAKIHFKNPKWAKLPKSGKLEKSKNYYNFVKIVTIVVNFCSGIVKFGFGLRNNILTKSTKRQKVQKDKTKIKKRVKFCDFIAVLHSCNVFSSSQSKTFKSGKVQN